MGGPLGQVNVQKACVFTTAFDQSKKFHLTQDVVGKPGKFNNKALPFWATQFNSYAFLVGGTEPDTLVDRTGIIGHCIQQQACISPNCVPDRASDPQICQALNTLGRAGCEVDTKFEVAAVNTAGRVPRNRIGDQVIKPQLRVKPNVGQHCWYVRDPAFQAGDNSETPAEQQTLMVCDAAKLNVNKCDDLAQDIATFVTLKIKDTRCVGGTGQAASLAVGKTCTLQAADDSFSNVRSSNSGSSEVRTSLPFGTEVRIRGFLREWVSVEFSAKDTQGQTVSLGAPETPSFIHKSQFSNPKYGVKCK